MIASLLPDTPLSGWEMVKAIWQPHLWIFVGSLLLSLVLTPVVRTIAMRWGVYDMPDARLKPHRHPIPYLGGVSIFLAWAIPVLVISAWLCLYPEDNVLSPATAAAIEAAAVVPEPQAPPEAGEEEAAEELPVRRPVSEMQWIEHPSRLFWIVGAALLMVVLGLVDDLKDISPKFKIVGQVLAAVMLAAGSMVFRAFPAALPADWGGGGLVPTGLWWVLALGLAVQIVLVVGASNATNLLDGLDGLCSGVTAFICVGFLVLATSLLAWDLFRYGQGMTVHYEHAEIIVLLGFALLGAVLGFLPYNFNPASIFMGDAGSMFLGFMAAVFMILFAERPEGFKWFLGSMVIFGLPIFDTGLALIRRLVNRRSIFAGDRSHFYDQLVDRGCSPEKSVVINYGLAIFFALAGVGIVFLRLRYAVVIYVLIFAAIAVAAFRMGFIRKAAPPVARGGPGDARGGPTG